MDRLPTPVPRVTYDAAVMIFLAVPGVEMVRALLTCGGRNIEMTSPRWIQASKRPPCGQFTPTRRMRPVALLHRAQRSGRNRNEDTPVAVLRIAVAMIDPHGVAALELEARGRRRRRRRP